MLTREKIIQTLRKEMPYLRRHYGVKRLGLFGSFAAQKQNRVSDVDLVVEFTRPIGLIFVDMAEHLEKKLGRKTDILTPAGIKDIRAKEVAKNIKRSLIYV